MPEGLNLTPLHPSHMALGAQMIEFAGWEMPARYGSAIQEHHAVRSAAGMFDVSHMGRIYLSGPDARALLDAALTTNVPSMERSQARYCMACNRDGGILDDLIVYRLAPQDYLVVCNAANRQVVLSIFQSGARALPNVQITDRTLETAMVALQGPEALEILSRLSDLDPNSLPPFNIATRTVIGIQMLVARTGYTGEDGAELMLEAGAAPRLWQALLVAGVAPCGMVARDSLRLEAALRLWGNDMDATINPYEAGLGRFVDLDKADFAGKAALARAKELGVERRLVGFEMVDRGIPRHGYPILDGDSIIGRVTSGGHSPTLDRSIGLGYVPMSYARKDTPLTIDVRGRKLGAKVVSLPFYRRPKP